MNKLLVLANVVVALVLAGAIALQATSDRNRVVGATYQNAENLTNALAEQTRQTLAALDLGITTAVEAIGPEGTGADRDLSGIHQMLKTRQETSVAAYAFFVLDATGTLIATSRTPTPTPVDLSGFPEFTWHRDRARTGLVLGPPRLGLVGHAEDRWIVNLARRIDNPDGTFGGIAAVALSLDYLLEFYDALRIGRNGALGLFSTDGMLLVRSPFDPDFLGRDMSQSLLFRQMRAYGDAGRFVGAYATDGIVRYTAYRRLGPDQAVVYVGLASDDVLAPWRNRLIFQIAIGLVAMAMFAGASATVRTYFVRRGRWEEARSERLKFLAAESAAITNIEDVSRLLEHVTEAACRLIGVHQAVTSLTKDGDLAQAIHVVRLSDKYALWRDYDEQPDGSGIYRLVPQTNRPMIMTQAELEAHPASKSFGAARDRYPPMRGWLAVPIIGPDGGNLGMIQLSDKTEGDFTADDLSEMTQLASITGVAIGNLLAMHARAAALTEAETAKAQIESIFESISDAVFAFDLDWRFVFLNSEAKRLIGDEPAEILGRNLWEAFPETVGTRLQSEYLRARAENVPVALEYRSPQLDRTFSVRAFPHSGGLTVYLQDITRRIETEERLRQSQKMDAIGQLTGGVAHDFNNLLTVILGYADDLVDYLADAPPEVREKVESIQAAGERAAELTHRLLAFARRQPLDPRSTDVNMLVAGIETLIRRTLSEDISIRIVDAPNLWKAVVDAGQLENALLNIAINARDAMPRGGWLTIESSNVTVDEIYAAQNGIEPGEYVLIAVSDTGEGISAATLEKVFDPFFTTKPPGKGSGLGLSMVYGFARQTGGHVKIYSELGHGTTVRLYLPRSVDDAAAMPSSRMQSAVPRGSEEILVVEDDDEVRRHTVSSLRLLGYKVEERPNGPDAMVLLESGRTFDLLITDVVLPGGMSGRAIAAAAAERLPSIKVLYMSGYTENAIVHHGRLNEGVVLLSKPFRRAELAHKVRQAIEG